jgi:hypothetical protein
MPVSLFEPILLDFKPMIRHITELAWLRTRKLSSRRLLKHTSVPYPTQVG